MRRFSLALLVLLGGAAARHAGVPPDASDAADPDGGGDPGAAGSDGIDDGMCFRELHELPPGFSLDGLHPSDTPGDHAPGDASTTAMYADAVRGAEFASREAVQ
jgi:hypothetical protein